MATASDQLARLLSLVPWLRAQPGVSKAEAAAAFAISVDQLEKDLAAGVHVRAARAQPEVFIDIDYLDSDRVSVIDAGSIDRPLRLRADEAVSLLVGLRVAGRRPRPGRPRGAGQRPGQDRGRGGQGRRGARAGHHGAAGGAAPPRALDPVAAIRDRPGRRAGGCTWATGCPAGTR